MTLKGIHIQRMRDALLRSAAFATLSTLASVTCNPAIAANATADQGSTIETVVVTAQKRAENLQDVAISAQVISGQVRIEQNANTLTALAQTVPAVFVTPAGRSNQLDIRGIGSGVSQVFDQSVGIFIDDIYHGRSRVTSATFLDLDSVEVLKGPQSTFFGNNAIAGAFNITTKKPGDHLEGWARAFYAPAGDQYAVEGAMGGPVTSNLGIRVAASFNGQGGWVPNITTGQKQPHEDNMAGRITLVYKPSDDLDATLKIEGSDNKNKSGLFLNIAHCPPAAPFTASGYCSSALASGHYSPDSTMDIGGQFINSDTEDAALTINYHPGDLTFTSVSGYTGYHLGFHAAFDAIPIPLVTSNLPEHYSQFSQELRVASPADQKLEYMGGVYFQTDRLGYLSDVNYYILSPVVASVPAFAPLVPYLPLTPEINYGQREHSYSAFGSLALHATDQLKISAGLRYSWVHKSFTWNEVIGTPTNTYAGVVPLPAGLQSLAGLVGLGNAGALSGSRSDHAFMPSAKIQYNVTPEAMVYVSYARGFKAGGFNGNVGSGVAADYPFDPEHVNAYEAGVKSEWFDKRVLVNLDVFLSDYKNLQVVSDLVTVGSTGFTSLVKNAGSARSKGVEFEGQWAVTDKLRLGADATYLDARYIHYPNVPATAIQQLAGAAIQDLSGRPTQFAPKWSGNVKVTYSTELPQDYQLTTELSAFLTSSFFNSETATDDPLHIQKGYARLDGRITIATPNDHWAVDVIAKNITDHRRIITFASNLPFSLGSMYYQYQQGRNIGFQVRYHW